MTDGEVELLILDRDSFRRLRDDEPGLYGAVLERLLLSPGGNGAPARQRGARALAR